MAPISEKRSQCRGVLSRVGARRKWRRSRRGVSEVVATILLLALTVTLFSAIFAFVTSFPSPPAQNSNQFQANLLLSSNGAYVTGLNITHLAGPIVPTNALVYLKSAVNPSSCPFGGPASISQGGIKGSTWSLGQTWSLNFTTFCGSSALDRLPDNITVIIVSQANLIFSVVLPGQQIVTSPAITSAWVTPSPVSKGSPFTISATIYGAVNPNSVYANLASVPGLPTTPVKMTLSQGTWSYNIPAPGATKTGNYLVFINASGAGGSTTTASVLVPVTSAGGGLFVTISASPTSGVFPLSVSFGATVSGANGSIAYQWSFGNGNFSTAAAPSNTYGTIGTYLVSLVVTDTARNQASATTTITVTGPGALIHGIAWSSMSSVSYSNCRYTGGLGNCPELLWQVWDNWTSPVVVSGTYYANATGTTHSWSVGATTVAGSSSTGAIDVLGTNAVWHYPATGTYSITLVLTVTNKNTGAFIGLVDYTLSSAFSVA